MSLLLSIVGLIIVSSGDLCFIMLSTGDFRILSTGEFPNLSFGVGVRSKFRFPILGGSINYLDFGREFAGLE